MSISFGIEVLNHYLCFIFQKKKDRTHHLPLMSARAYSTWFSIPKHLALRQKFETDLYVRPVRRWKIMTLGSENHLPYVYPTKCSAATPKQTAEARWKQRERKQTNKQTARSGDSETGGLHSAQTQTKETPNLPSGCIRRWVRIKSPSYFCSDCISLSSSSTSRLGEHAWQADEAKRGL